MIEEKFDFVFFSLNAYDVRIEKESIISLQMEQILNSCVGWWRMGIDEL